MVILAKLTVATVGLHIMLFSCVVLTGQGLSEIPDAVEDIPINVTVAEGKTAILPCKVDTYDDQMVVWMNPKRIVVSQKESRYINDPRLSIERPFVGDYNLHIRNVRYEDRGDYMCTINTRPVTIKRIRLIVEVPSRILDYSSSNIVTVKEGSEVELVCNATGVPIPTITWYRRTDESPQARDRVGADGEALVIHNISRYCGGIYECMAFNGVPPAVQRQIEVKVQFKPEIRLLNKRIGQYLEKETMLECVITASPQGSNIWRFGNIQPAMNEDWKYHLEVYEDSKYTVSLTLRIKNVRPEDFGIYTCEASNQLGHAARDMQLYGLMVCRPCLADDHLSYGDIMTGTTFGAGDAHSSGIPDITFGFYKEYIVPTPPRMTTIATTPYRHPLDIGNRIDGGYERVTILNNNGETAQIHKSSSSSETQILGQFGTENVRISNTCNTNIATKSMIMFSLLACLAALEGNCKIVYTR